MSWQLVAMREVLAVWGGNELAVVTALVVWLVGSAVGTAASDRCWAHPALRWLVVSTAAVCPLLPRAIGAWAPPEWEGLPHLGWMAVACVVACGWPAWVSGNGFAWWSRRAAAAGWTPVRVYTWDAVGGALACVAGLSLGAGWASPSMWVWGSGGLACAMTTRRRWLPLVAVAIVGGAWAVGPVARFGLDRWFAADAARGQWRGCAHGHYARVCVGETGRQCNVFVDGRAFVSAPDPWSMEFPAAVAMAAAPPRGSALLIGGDVWDAAAYWKRGSQERLWYAPPDVQVVTVGNACVSSVAPDAVWSAKGTVTDIHGFLGDHRRALGLVWQFAATPVSVTDNARLSVAFARQVDAALRPDGAWVLVLPGAANAFSPATRSWLRSVRTTLAQVFPHVRYIGGVTSVFVASRSQRAVERVFRAAVPGVSPAVRLRLKEAVRTSEERGFERMLASEERANRSDAPGAYLWGWARIVEQRSPQGGARIPMVVGAVVVVAVTVGSLLLLGPWIPARQRSVFAAGCIGMLAHIAMMYGVAVHIGALYYYVAVATALFLGGAAVGARLLSAALGRPDLLVWWQTGALAAAVVWFWFPHVAVGMAVFALVGMGVGIAFGAAVAQRNPARDAARAWTYDNAGAAVGALAAVGGYAVWGVRGVAAAGAIVIGAWLWRLRRVW